MHVSGVTLHHNLALRNNSAGFSVYGNSALLQRNVSQGNGTGFELQGSGIQVFESVASGNTIGFTLQGILSSPTGNQPPGTIVLDHVSAITNLIHGLRIEPHTAATLRNSNIYGNGVSEPAVACGVRNESDLNFVATRNFWGSPYGPGSDPADAVCNIGASTSATAPFFPYPIAIPPFSN